MNLLILLLIYFVVLHFNAYLYYMKKNQQKKRISTDHFQQFNSPNTNYKSSKVLKSVASTLNASHHYKSTYFKVESLANRQLNQFQKNLSIIKRAINQVPQENPENKLLRSQRLMKKDNSQKQQSTYRKKSQLLLIDQLCDTERKLRQTKSTQCQSPKTNHKLSNTKVEDYTKIKMLGKGRFAEVFLVKHDQTGFIGALKVIKKAEVYNQEPSKRQKIMNQLISEIKVQSFLNHPNLIKLYDFFDDEFNIYLFLELGSDGHLYKLLDKVGKFSQQSTSIIIRQITNGVKFMHSRSIIHRDLKLENIVFTHGMAKICDFGWSVYEPSEFRQTICGTPLYLSPEVLIGRKYNDKIDIWAIGTLTHQIFTHKNPFSIVSREQLDKIIYLDFQMNVGSPEIKSFINFILRKNPSKRPDAQIVLSHPFIKKYEDLQTSEQISWMSHPLKY